MKSIRVCTAYKDKNFEKFFIVENEKDDSIILAKAYPEEIKVKTISGIKISTEVVGVDYSFFAVDQVHKKILAVSDIDNFAIADFEDIIKVECLEDGNTITSKSSMRTIGGAALGGALAGGAGMIVGGLSGKSKTSKELKEVKVKILLRDINHPTITIVLFKGSFNTEKYRDLYTSTIEPARKIVDLVSIIIDNTDKISINNRGNIEHGNTTTNIADELIKLAQLKQQGILTEDEFNKQKDKLLSKE